MNEVIQAMLQRRSIRKFKPDMVEKDLLEQIIQAGLYAANGCGRQATLTLAITNPELRRRIVIANRKVLNRQDEYDPFFGAPVILLVLADKQYPNYMYDGSLVMGNMLLAAHALGLGSIWINRARQEFEQEEFKQLLRDLNVEGEWEGIGHCAVGYIDGEAPKACPA